MPLIVAAVVVGAGAAAVAGGTALGAGIALAVKGHRMRKEAENIRRTKETTQEGTIPPFPSQVNRHDIGEQPGSIDECVQNTLQEMRDSDDIVAILRHFQDNMMIGRPLDEYNKEAPIEGETTDVSISRLNVFDSLIEEFSPDYVRYMNLRLPLDVIFHGEQAQDCGGPRRHFFDLSLRVIKTRLFEESSNGFNLTNNESLVRQNAYFVAGVVLGLSMLQNGPMPSFFTEELVQKLLSIDIDVQPSVMQLRTGFAQLGLIELMQKKTCLTYLLLPTAAPRLTRRQLIKLLVPQFSEPQSNRRMQEDRTYSEYVAYLKEVDAGLRIHGGHTVTLEMILLFCTGSSTPPILGFPNQPCIIFVKDGTLPTSNTCALQMYLPLTSRPLTAPDTKKKTPSNTKKMTGRDTLFALYDYAFSSEYFGKI